MAEEKTTRQRGYDNPQPRLHLPEDSKGPESEIALQILLTECELHAGSLYGGRKSGPRALTSAFLNAVGVKEITVSATYFSELETEEIVYSNRAGKELYPIDVEFTEEDHGKIVGFAVNGTITVCVVTVSGGTAKSILLPLLDETESYTFVADNPDTPSKGASSQKTILWNMFENGLDDQMIATVLEKTTDYVERMREKWENREEESDDSNESDDSDDNSVDVDDDMGVEDDD